MNYNTKVFSDSDKMYLKSEFNYFKEKNPEHVCIIVQVDSNILKLEKHKFLVSKELLFEDFVSALKKKIFKCQSSENLLFYSVQTSNNDIQLIKNFKETISSMYSKFVDETTNILIIRISRLTTFKKLKSYFF
jgi:hypothetical protein